jgi:hypothetical protein
MHDPANREARLHELRVYRDASAGIRRAGTIDVDLGVSPAPFLRPAPDDLVELVKRWIEQRKAEGAGTDSLMFPNAGCTRERRSATAIVMTSATESPSGSPRIERLLSSTSS